ncbi:MAG: hypothetical protein ACR2FY_13535 [Pirellulaceae bacterium]
MSIKEIETEITRLPPTEVSQLLEWLSEHHARLWDEQIERDLEAGRLNNVMGEVEKEIAAGLARPL